MATIEIKDPQPNQHGAGYYLNVRYTFGGGYSESGYTCTETFYFSTDETVRPRLNAALEFLQAVYLLGRCYGDLPPERRHTLVAQASGLTELAVSGLENFYLAEDDMRDPVGVTGVSDFTLTYRDDNGVVYDVWVTYDRPQSATRSN